jgi:hypothetical protein
MFIAKGFKAVFRAIIALMSFYKDKMIGKSFEEVLTFIGDIMKTEVFRNTRYEEYKELREKGESPEMIREKMPHASEYEFVFRFKDICREIKISNALITKLESRYYSIGAKLNKL